GMRSEPVAPPYVVGHARNFPDASILHHLARSVKPHRKIFQSADGAAGVAMAMDKIGNEEEIVMFHFTAARSLGLLVSVGTASLFALAAGPTANAAPTASCPAPGAASVQAGTGDASCSATSTSGGAAAAYGIDGTAAADAAATSLSLAIGQNGGTATSSSEFLSGPAAIALGPGAQATTVGVRPGLSIGIAGPGAVVTVTGVSTPTCTGGPGFAGDFQTLQGCVSLH